MARIPTYQSQGRTLDIGSDTANLQSLKSPFSSGAGDFAAGIQSAAASFAKISAKERAETDQRNKLVEGLQEDSAFSGLQQATLLDYEEAERNADPSGAGFVDGVVRKLDERLNAYVNSTASNLSPERERELFARRAAHADKLRTSVLGKALNHETNLIRKGIADAASRAYDDASAIIAQLPNADGLSLGMERLTETADRLNLSPKAREVFLKDGQSVLSGAAVIGAAKLNPQKLLEAGVGVYRGLPSAVAHPEAAKVIEGANLTSIPPEIMLAIANKESGINPNVVPRRKDGTLMSSAKGTFQYLDNSAYGNVDWRDTRGQAFLLGRFLEKVKGTLEARGVQATPGTLYMFHNVGEGVGHNLVRSDPDKPMSQVLFEVYGNKRYGPNSRYPGELMRDVVGRNNPSLYKPGMTVGQVRSRYESEMQANMKATAKYLTQSDASDASADEIARNNLKQALGFDPVGIRYSDLNKALGIAQQELKAGAQKRGDSQEGYAYITKQIRMSPNDPKQQKLVDDYIRGEMPDLYEGFVQGDERAIAQARTVVKNTNYVPKPILEGARELIHSSQDSPQRRSAYEFMAHVSEHNTVAWDSAKIDGETQKRVDLYRKYRDTLGPAAAAKKLADHYTPEAIAQRKALDKTMDGKKGEITKLKPDDFTQHLSKGFVRNGTPFDNPNNPADASSRFMVDAKFLYRHYREQNETPEDAKKLAAADLERLWGPSSAFVGPTDRAPIMRNPPDRYYSTTTLGMQPFEDQAREIVQEELNRRYGAVSANKSFGPAPGMRPVSQHAKRRMALQNGANNTDFVPAHDAEKLDVRVRATPETETDIREKQPPRYQVWYRDPQDGTFKIAYTPDGKALWAPNVDRMQDEDQDAELAAIQTGQARSQSVSDFFGTSPKQLGNIIRQKLRE